jgi:hypothetical protein
MRCSSGILRWLMMALAVVAAAGCGGTSRPAASAPCITERSTHLLVRWGHEDDSLRTITYYEVNAKGEVTRYRGTTRDSVQSDYRGWIPHTAYCERIASTRSAFLQTQAMNARGVRARFMEYVNPNGDVFLRVVWNPDLQTFQSRFIRPEYDAFMQLLHELN